MHFIFCEVIVLKPLISVLLMVSLYLSIQPVFAVDVVVMAIFGETVILKVNGTKHKLKLGEEPVEGIRVTEVGGDKVSLEINNKIDTYDLGGHASFNNESVDNSKHNPTARIWPRNDMYVTHGSINDFTVQFMVDTGATWIAMSEGVAKRLGINYYRAKKGFAGTASGVAAIYKVTLDKVKVGEIELRNVKAAVISDYQSNQVLLGNSFLKRVEITRTKQVMILKKK